MIVALVWISGGLAAIALGFSVLNRFTWPRGEPGARFEGHVSVLVPARNEADNLRACIRALAESHHPFFEVIVYDDGSTDGSRELLATLKDEFPCLRVEVGGALPTGWVGKAHACHRLSEAASGDVLLFVDADVRVTPYGVGRIASLFERLGADVVTAVPAQRMNTFAEKLVMPLLHLTYVSWFPLVLTHRSRNVRFLAANGQVLAVRRAAYEKTGGFSSVRAEVVDDMAFCRLAKRTGLRVVFADGHHIARCRMYDSVRAIVQGFSKNLYEGLQERPVALAAVLGLYLGAFVMPYVALGFGWVDGSHELVVAGGSGTAVNVFLRVMLSFRHDHPWSSVVLHPLGVLAFVGIAVNSAYWSWRGTLRWRGRVYSRRSERLPPRTRTTPGGAVE